MISANIEGHEFEICPRIREMEIGLLIVRRRIFPSQIAAIKFSVREMRYAKRRKCEECKNYIILHVNM